MKKLIKNFLATFLFVLVLLQVPMVAYCKANIPSATSDFYVNDFAGVFSESEKAQLMDNAVALANDHDGIQVVITTIESLNGDSVESYAHEMYEQYGIGKDDMGILILLSTGDRELRLEVGKAMEAYINDSKAGRFIDNYAIPSFKEDKFNEGLINLQTALIDEIVTNVENDSNTTPVATTKPKNNFNFFAVLGILLFACFVLALIGAVVVIIRKIISKSKEKQQMIESLTNKLHESEEKAYEIQHNATERIGHLKGEISKLSGKYNSLESKYQTLEDRYSRVNVLYPTADKDVTSMIEEEIEQRDIALATEVNSVIRQLIHRSADKDIVSEVSEAISRYSNLSEKQKSYVKSDINKLKDLYEKSLSLKREYDRKMEEEKNKKLAVAAASSITAIISCISVGKAKDLRKLKEAKSTYDNLSSSSKKYFDTSILDKLDKLYKEAKRDKEREEEEELRRKRREEEERRRRQNSSYSSSSHYGSFSSHHSGFGGHSAGGGASRKF